MSERRPRYRLESLRNAHSALRGALRDEHDRECRAIILRWLKRVERAINSIADGRADVC